MIQFFLHLYLLFYGLGYRTVSAILLLDIEMIISYKSPAITISLSLSIWSQFAMQASTCCVPRNQAASQRWKWVSGSWVMGHGSNGSPFLDGSHGSWVTASDPLTHDEITAQ